MNYKGNRWKKGIGIRCKARRTSNKKSIEEMVALARKQPRPTSYGQMTALLEMPRLEPKELPKEDTPRLKKRKYEFVWVERAPILPESVSEEELRKEEALEIARALDRLFG